MHALVQCGLQYLGLKFSPQLLPHVSPLLLPLCQHSLMCRLCRLRSLIMPLPHGAQISVEVLRQAVTQGLEEKGDTATNPPFFQERECLLIGSVTPNIPAPHGSFLSPVSTATLQSFLWRSPAPSPSPPSPRVPVAQKQVSVRPR